MFTDEMRKRLLDRCAPEYRRYQENHLKARDHLQAVMDALDTYLNDACSHSCYPTMSIWDTWRHMAAAMHYLQFPCGMVPAKDWMEKNPAPKEGE